MDIADLGLYAAKRSGRDRWVGIEAGDASGANDDGGDPEETLRRFREDPEAAVAKREVRVHAAAGTTLLQWE
ncbi:MAG: hypothetical protein QOJ16_2016 [Acidobacteriota bacterium]|nr:hypothetical protein [Acidobacteriota bacterium]